MASSQPGLFSRWFFKQRTQPEPVVPTPAPEPARPPEPEPVVVEAEPEPDGDREEILALLESTLDSLGSAHHRPFSRG